MTYLDHKYEELAYARKHGYKTLEAVALACIARAVKSGEQLKLF